MHCRPLEHLAKYLSIFFGLYVRHGCELCLAWKLIQCLWNLRTNQVSRLPRLPSSNPFALACSVRTKWQWSDPMGAPSRKLWLIRDRNKVGWFRMIWGMEGSQVVELYPRLRSQTHRGTVQGHIVTTTHAKKKRFLKGSLKKMPFPLVLIWKINSKIRVTSEV